MELSTANADFFAVFNQLDPDMMADVRQVVYVVQSAGPERKEQVRRALRDILDEDDDDDYDDMTPEEATQEILDDPEFMEMIRQGEEDMRAGRTVPWELVR